MLEREMNFHFKMLNKKGVAEYVKTDILVGHCAPKSSERCAFALEKLGLKGRTVCSPLYILSLERARASLALACK